MLPPVELTNTATCSSDSTDSSLLNLFNTSSHTYDFEIPLKDLATQTLLNRDLREAKRRKSKNMSSKCFLSMSELLLCCSIQIPIPSIEYWPSMYVKAWLYIYSVKNQCLYVPMHFNLCAFWSFTCMLSS